MNISSISYRALALALLAGAPAAATAQQVAAADTAAPTPSAEQSVPGQSDDPQQAGSDIIVTGTRATGITAAESAAPIKVIGEEEMSHVGQPNLNQVLTQLVPSFVAQAFGGDTANLTLSARLRGLSPNHTLVLINGKRRHGTANLAVLGGPYQGAAAPDLDLISPSSVKRIEVLEQGAAAQYGSDAIAGVINIILKDDDDGGSGYVTAGENYDTGGRTYAATVHLATKVGDAGFFNVTAFHRYHDFTQVGGIDCRATKADGTAYVAGNVNCAGSTITAIRAPLYSQLAGTPYVNRINGDAESSLTNVQYNTGYDYGTFNVYSFGTYSRRIASAYENVRLPDRIARTVAGVTTYFDPDGDTPVNGFNPREKIVQDDFAFTGGLKGALDGGFRYDFSATFGQDRNAIYTVDSANASLYADTGYTPTTFYDGFFKATEFTANADFAKEFEMGWTTPLTLAFGGEYRRNVYEIGSGDAASIYKEGGQSYPGFRPTDAGIHARSNKALYVDVSASPVDALKLDVATRYEHYSDFGSKVTWKATGRYDFSDAFALRGTVSTGFRAPTLAESYYSATNVSPTAAIVQLPANSAAAKILGFSDLKPERSMTYSAGVVLRPAPRVTLTVDAYQVTIKDRILGTGTIYSAGGATNYALVRTAVVANGNVLDPTVTQTGISVFTNGADTRTRGIDAVASYSTDFAEYGRTVWTLSGNYNKTDVTKVLAGPILTSTTGTTAAITLFSPTTISNIESASPRFKFIGSANHTIGDLTAVLRGTLYGKSSNLTSPNGGTYYRQRIPTAFITDLELGYSITPELQLSLGANNLFNKKPPTVELLASGLTVGGGTVIDAPLNFSPYGINGGYYYARMNFSF